MTAIAAHRCRLYIPGTSTSSFAAFTAMTEISGGSNLVWQMADSTGKQVFDPSVATIFENGGGTGSTVIPDSIDYLFGTATFGSGEPSVGIVDGAYYTMFEVGTVTDFTASFSSDVLDSSTMDAEAYRNKMIGLIDFSGSLSLLERPYQDYDATQTDNSFGRLLRSGTPKILQIDFPDTTQTLRAWVNIESYENTGSVDGLVESSVSFTGSPRTALETGLTSGSAYSLGDVGA
jgi:hypothetical protein